jgi:ubiquinone/menaquinone biosynthesis C-methylase UbiE
MTLTEQNRTEQNRTEAWYNKYYQEKGKDRNDLLNNSEVLFQHLAFEDSVISALRKAALDKERAKILDVGCGGGGSLTRFMQLGFVPSNLYGIDIINTRIEDGKTMYPNFNLICDNATSMPYESNYFDLTFESTMFVQITDEQMSQNISNEMLRVTQKGGYILLIDWRYSKPGNRDYLGLSTKRIQKLFSVNSSSEIICQKRGALVPPVGRTISKHFPPIYFLLRSVFPFLAGQTATLLQKHK